MNKNKVILIFRTEDQLDQLKTAAIKDGYKEESLILYDADDSKHWGSARFRFTQIREFVRNSSASKVYVWDILTVGHKVWFITELINILTSRGIPLTFVKDGFTTLNEDGSENIHTQLYLSSLIINLNLRKASGKSRKE